MDSESDSSEDESAGKTMKDKLQGLTESKRRKLEQMYLVFELVQQNVMVAGY